MTTLREKATSSFALYLRRAGKTIIPNIDKSSGLPTLCDIQ